MPQIKKWTITKIWAFAFSVSFRQFFQYTLIIPHKNTLIEIEPDLFLTKTVNWGSIVLKVFLVYMYDVFLVKPMKILNSTAAIN